MSVHESAAEAGELNGEINEAVIRRAVLTIEPRRNLLDLKREKSIPFSSELLRLIIMVNRLNENLIVKGFSVNRYDESKTIISYFY